MGYQWYKGNPATTKIDQATDNVYTVTVSDFTINKAVTGHNETFKCEYGKENNTVDFSANCEIRLNTAAYKIKNVNLVSDTDKIFIGKETPLTLSCTHEIDNISEPIEYTWYYKTAKDTDGIIIPDAHTDSITFDYSMNSSYLSALSVSPTIEFYVRLSNTYYTTKSNTIQIPTDINDYDLSKASLKLNCDQVLNYDNSHRCTDEENIRYPLSVVEIIMPISTENVTYTWFKQDIGSLNSNIIKNATTSSYIVDPQNGLAESGSYWCEVSNGSNYTNIFDNKRIVYNNDNKPISIIINDAYIHLPLNYYNPETSTGENVRLEFFKNAQNYAYIQIAKDESNKPLDAIYLNITEPTSPYKVIDEYKDYSCFIKAHINRNSEYPYLSLYAIKGISETKNEVQRLQIYNPADNSIKFDECVDLRAHINDDGFLYLSMIQSPDIKLTLPDEQYYKLQNVNILVASQTSNTKTKKTKQTITIICDMEKATNNKLPITYDWYKNGKLIHSTINDNTLEVDISTDDYKGIYSCDVSNEYCLKTSNKIII